MKTNIRSFLKFLAIVALISLPLLSCARSKNKIDNSPVPDFELDRFLGTWYELARFDHKFERGLKSVTATYNMREDGKIRVLNSGYRNGVMKTAEGKAKVVNPGWEDGYLKVSFFLFFYADYRVLYIDDAYRYALIGSKTDKYLWLMSRTPTVDQFVKDRLMIEAIRRGYNPAGLIWD